MTIDGDARKRMAACPSCGAPLRFRGGASVVAICAYCHATLVREGADIENIGKQAELLADASPIQLGTEGVHRGSHFTVVGRIQYRYGSGLWNEWHVLHGNGKSGWLSDANQQYTITYLAPPAEVPLFGKLQPGNRVTLKGGAYVVTDIESAEVVAGEGELPFRFTAGWKAPVVDLRGEGTAFASIDYSDEKPAIYLGEALPFDAFKFVGIRDPDRYVEGKGRALNFKCGGCGASIEKRVAASEVVACTSCGTVTDVSHGVGEIVQRNERNEQADPPTIPLGTVLDWHGARYDAVGYLRREIVVEGAQYRWSEYLLHNLKQGYLWISEYQGHFSVIKVTTSLPELSGKGSGDEAPMKAKYLGDTFDHFQRSKPVVVHLAGEFNWRVQLGDECLLDDYVAPPLILSVERTEGEITCSLGEYVEPDILWRALGLHAPPPERVGIAPNQPSPFKGRVLAYWLVFVAFAAIAALMQFGFMAANAGGKAKTVPFHVAAGGTAREVSEPFEVGGWMRTPLLVRTSSNVSGTWVALRMQLTEVGTGRAFALERELGVRWGGEGGAAFADDLAEIKGVPSGQYTLAIDATAGAIKAPTRNASLDITGSVALRRAAVPWSNFWLLLGFLAVFPVVMWMRARSYETRRWAESDHPRSSDSSDGDSGSSGSDDD